MNRRNFFIAVFMLLILPLAAQAAAPDIPVKSMQGQKQNVNQFIGKGQWTVVMLWAHNCHICNQEVQTYNFFHDEHKSKGIRVLGVSVDGWANHKKAQGFVNNHELDFANVIIEPKQSLMVKFGGGKFVGTPTFFIYNREGELVARNIGAISGDEVYGFIKSQDKTIGKDKS